MSEGIIFCYNIGVRESFGDIKSSIIITSPKHLTDFEKKQAAKHVINKLVEEYDFAENELVDGTVYYTFEDD